MKLPESKVGGDKSKIIWLLVGLVAVIGMTALFIWGLSSGGGDGGGQPYIGGESGTVVLDTDFDCGEKCEGNFINVDSIGYENLILNQKSFIVIVDQTACVTGDRLRGFIDDYVGDSGLKVYRIMFEDMKQTSLYDKITYYPSVAIISEGKMVAWLDAESNEDKPMYDEYESFVAWLNKYIKK